jgi:hypothetical protein
MSPALVIAPSRHNAEAPGPPQEGQILTLPGARHESRSKLDHRRGPRNDGLERAADASSKRARDRRQRGAHSREARYEVIGLPQQQSRTGHLRTSEERRLHEITMCSICGRIVDRRLRFEN